MKIELADIECEFIRWSVMYSNASLALESCDDSDAIEIEEFIDKAREKLRNLGESMSLDTPSMHKILDKIWRLK